MKQSGNSSDDGRLEAYLDGLMQEPELSAFEAELRTNPQLLKQAELQVQLDNSLNRLFPERELTAARLAAIREELNSRKQQPAARKRELVRLPMGWLVGVASAAAILWIALNLWSVVNEPERPYFEPQPVTELYVETVSTGFEPYYECREESRFIDTFASRQGVPLTLAKMPADRKMLGLSYPGGLSRETTAMLGRVQQKPVMVFVDSIERDHPQAGQTTDSGLNVFREARDGLVFYEVTPLETPSFINYLVPVDSPAPRYFSDVD